MFPSIQNPLGAAQQLVHGATIGLQQAAGQAAQQAAEAVVRAAEPAVTVLQSADEPINATAGHVERGLARTVPVAVGFLGKLLGLGGIASRIRGIVNRVRSRVDSAIGAVIRRVRPLLARAGHTLGQVVSSPMRFAGSLARSIRTGLARFAANTLGHLRTGMVSWLTRSLGAAGLKLPRDFSLRSIARLAMDVIGLTTRRVRAKLVRHIGRRAVATIDTALRAGRRLIATGPRSVWSTIKGGAGRVAEAVGQAIKRTVVSRAMTLLGLGR